ncbi:MAG: hypothetical protein OSB19_02100 [Opitutaceae bacterium]|nr:hypothetical protein [Opitutaceae bacterium]
MRSRAQGGPVVELGVCIELQVCPVVTDGYVIPGIQNEGRRNARYKGLKAARGIESCEAQVVAVSIQAELNYALIYSGGLEVHAEDPGKIIRGRIANPGFNRKGRFVE